MGISGRRFSHARRQWLSFSVKELQTLQFWNVIRRKERYAADCESQEHNTFIEESMSFSFLHYDCLKTFLLVLNLEIMM